MAKSRVRGHASPASGLTLPEFAAIADKVWPYGHLGLRKLFVPDSLTRELPIPRLIDEVRQLYADTMTDLERTIAGQTPAFDKACEQLASYGLNREDLVRLTNVPVPLYQWVNKTADRLARQRRDVERRRRSYADLLRQLRRAHLLKPATRRDAIREVVLVLRYLRAFPTNRQLHNWRKRLGVNRQGSLDKLHVWTDVGRRLIEHLASASPLRAVRRSPTRAIGAAVRRPSPPRSISRDHRGQSGASPPPRPPLTVTRSSPEQVRFSRRAAW